MEASDTHVPVASSHAPLELRVHGIGSHGPLSALGPPVPDDGDADAPTTVLTKKPLVSVFRAPTAPAHRVAMLNWSRVTRTAFGPFWWFAFPLTLANAAGFTSADKTNVHIGPISFHRVIVAVWTLVITVGFVLWPFALIESLPAKVSPEATRLLEVAVTALLMSVILRRIIRERPGPVGAHGKTAAPPRMWWTVQLLVVFVVGAGLLAWHPATRVIDGDPRAYTSLQTWASSCWTISESRASSMVEAPDDPDTIPCPNRLDVLSGYVVGTSALAAVSLAAVAIAATKRRRERRSFRAVLILTGALVLMNFVFAALRNALDWVSGYASHIGPLAGRCTFEPATEHREVLGCLNEVSARHSLRPFQLGRDWPLYDLVPVAFVWLLVAGLVVVGVWAVIRAGLRKVWRESPTRQFERQARKATRIHRIVTGLPWNLRWVSLGAVLAVVGTAAVTVAIGTSQQSTRYWHPWLVLVAIHLASLLIPIVVIATSMLPPVRTAVSTVGDVIGYWPRRSVALSGHSYTEEVTESITRTVVKASDPIVLVGHSQGSVLCYTAVTRLAEAPPEGAVPPDVLDHTSLVTCGSPLQTLYAGFFPRYFERQDFADLQTRIAGRWSNCWRPTDPIGSAFLPHGDIEIAPKLDYRGKVSAHSDYWTEPQQAEEVARLLDLTPEADHVGPATFISA